MNRFFVTLFKLLIMTHMSHMNHYNDSETIINMVPVER